MKIPVSTLQLSSTLVHRWWNLSESESSTSRTLSKQWHLGIRNSSGRKLVNVYIPVANSFKLLIRHHSSPPTWRCHHYRTLQRSPQLLVITISYRCERSLTCTNGIVACWIKTKQLPHLHSKHLLTDVCWMGRTHKTIELYYLPTVLTFLQDDKKMASERKAYTVNFKKATGM